MTSGGTRHDALDQRLDLLAAHEVGFEVLLLGVGEIFGIAHHRFERLAQDRDALRRRAGRRHHRIAHVLPREDQLQHAAVGIVLGELHHQRRRVHAGMLLEPELHDHIDLLLRDPFRLAGIETAPRHAGGAVGFLALDREQEVGGAGIAGDDLHLGAEHAVEDVGEDDAVGARAGAGHDHLARAQVLDAS